MFPSSEISNFVICVTGKGASKDFSSLIVDEFSALAASRVARSRGIASEMPR